MPFLSSNSSDYRKGIGESISLYQRGRECRLGHVLLSTITILTRSLFCCLQDQVATLVSTSDWNPHGEFGHIIMCIKQML
jgi:hypothetical protein